MVDAILDVVLVFVSYIDAIKKINAEIKYRMIAKIMRDKVDPMIMPDIFVCVKNFLNSITK